MMAYDGALFFNADDGVHGNELWRYDPATGRTALVADLWLGGEDSRPNNFTIYDGALFFYAVDGTPNWKLRRYRTDEGLRTLEHTPGPFPGSMAVLGAHLYLISGSSLFRYDGTTDEFTTLLSPFDLNSVRVEYGLTAYDGQVVFQAFTHEHGRELWAYDPVSETARIVSDIVPGSDGSDPQSVTAYDGALYFFAVDEAHGAEFWRYDGAEPPRLVADINPGPDHSVASAFTPFEGQVYFHANDGVSGAELWVYDPMTDALALAVDLAPGSDSSSPYWIVPYDGALYVTTRGPEAGGAIWRIERTPPTSGEAPSETRPFALYPPSPNPASGSLALSFSLPSPADVRLEAFDVLGRRVAQLADGPHVAGEHKVTWNGSRLPSGVYVVRLRAGNHVQTQRVTLVR
jgi:ELWxxDGT repeat protein